MQCSNIHTYIVFFQAERPLIDCDFSIAQEGRKCVFKTTKTNTCHHSKFSEENTFTQHIRKSGIYAIRINGHIELEYLLNSKCGSHSNHQIRLELLIKRNGSKVLIKSEPTFTATGYITQTLSPISTHQYLRKGDRVDLVFQKPDCWNSDCQGMEVNASIEYFSNGNKFTRQTKQTKRQLSKKAKRQRRNRSDRRNRGQS